MTKWDYIRLISKKGSPDGTHGGVLDLLQWCGKPNTAAVTEEEARAFWEQSGGLLAEPPDSEPL